MEAQNAAETDQKNREGGGASPRHKSNDSGRNPDRKQTRRQSDAGKAMQPSLGSSAESRSKPKLDPPTSNSAAGSRAASPDEPDSDAETVVLPGKDGYSPSKTRKVRQEDNVGSDADEDKAKAQDGSKQVANKTKLSRQSAPGDKGKTNSRKDGSSGLSSAPTSPSSKRAADAERWQRRRKGASAQPSSSSDDDSSPAYTHKTAREKLKPTERLVPHKRKAPKLDSDDDTDTHKSRRQRTTSAGLEERRSKDSRLKYGSRTRSPSPQLRQHRRSMSSNNPSNSIASRKRKPMVHQTTDYQSDDSSASGSPHHRGSKLRSQPSASANAESATSPVKIGPHKKHLDAHGQTFLARACARGDYPMAKQRLKERPEDLNVADYAGNTPLQIASLHGDENIVELLINAGANLDCVNYDKETPLLDAVDNGHLGVVKRLLDAGVNPRRANVNGEEPIDRITDDTDNAGEIRAALTEAKKRAGERRRTSEERAMPGDQEARGSHAPNSPRQSPTASVFSGLGRRSGNVRSTKTRNDLLYVPLDDKTLRQAAGRGDEETVARILNVKESTNDPESMVAAARGGHDVVMELLLGLGRAKPDPAPCANLPLEFATPMLAAIGQENFKVVELLLDQKEFDPTRTFKGETYYEIARRRQGTNWKEEEDILKKAYDKKRGKARPRDQSPNRKEGETRKKSGSSKLSSPRERRRRDSIAGQSEDQLQKKNSIRSKREDRNGGSDRESSPSILQKPPKVSRIDSDAANASSDGDSHKPKRKLISKGELRGERDKHRRSSIASNASSLKEPSSPHEPRNAESQEKQKLSEKYHDRTKALRRDETKDRASSSVDGTTKRQRTSVTPDRSALDDHNDKEAPIKKRKIDGSDKEKRAKRVHSPESKMSKTSSNWDASAKASRATKVAADDASNEAASREESDDMSVAQEASGTHVVTVKSEDVDVAMPDAIPEGSTLKATQNSEGEEPGARKSKAHDKKKQALSDAQSKADEDKSRQLEKERKVQANKEEEAARKLQQEEQEERKRREAEDAARVEAEEKQRVAEDEKKHQEAEERRQKEEIERFRQEELQRAAAEEAKRQREEAEKKEREQRERMHREEMERKRAAREAEQRRIREEQERTRLDKLPPLLRWLDRCPDPKLASVAEKFKHLQGVRYDTIRPQATGTSEGREQWLLNTDVALLLGEKDLDLSMYTAWDRLPVTVLAKKTLWRTEWTRYSLIASKFWDLGLQLPDYYEGEHPRSLRLEAKERLKQAAWERFLAMDMFFVKASELMYTVPHMSHLRNLKLAIEYRELAEDESQLMGWKIPQKWKQDPDANRFHGFAPRIKFYVNGAFVEEDKPTRHQTSKEPFPEARVPRRGLLQVFRDDPDYARLCLEQGLEHLVKSHSPSIPNGIVKSSPTQQNDSALPMARHGTNGHHSTNEGVVNGVNGAH